MRTLPVWEWIREGLDWRALCEALDGSAYVGEARVDPALGGWVAVVTRVIEGDDCTRRHEIHRSEHERRDDATAAAGAALARAIKLREGPNQGPRTESKPKEKTDGSGNQNDRQDDEATR